MKKIVFVSDLFIDNYRGGAELTTAAIMTAAPKNKFSLVKIHSQHVNGEVVDKFADAHWVICNFSSLNDKAKIYLCKNADYSIIEYANIIMKLLNVKLKIKKINRSLKGTPRKILNISLAKKLGWNSKTSLVEGLKITLNDFKKNYKQYT